MSAGDMRKIVRFMFILSPFVVVGGIGLHIILTTDWLIGLMVLLFGAVMSTSLFWRFRERTLKRR